MTDNLTKEQRSFNMSRIKSKWTMQEILLHNYLKGNKIRHKMHPNIFGNPDIEIKNAKVLIFINGCFWHKCPKCYKEPKSNKEYWVPKIERNEKRDKKNLRLLRTNGYKVIVIWEHELKEKKKAIEELLKLIRQ